MAYDFFILIIEDKDIPLVSIAMPLLDAGIRFHTVSHFNQAYDELKKHKFNCIICDISSGNLDNMSYARQLRALHGAAVKLPKIVIVSDKTALTVHNLKGDGIWRNIEAPVEPSKVVDALSEFYPSIYNNFKPVNSSSDKSSE